MIQSSIAFSRFHPPSRRSRQLAAHHPIVVVAIRETWARRRTATSRPPLASSESPASPLDKSGRPPRSVLSSGNRTTHAGHPLAHSSALERRAIASIDQRTRTAMFFAKREPFRRLARLGVSVLAKRSRRHDAAVLLAEPPAPMRAADIANVSDRRAAKLRRPRHAPTRHNKLALAVGSIANDRSHLVGEDPWEQRQVARPIVTRADQSRIAA